MVDLNKNPPHLTQLKCLNAYPQLVEYLGSIWGCGLVGGRVAGDGL